MFDLQRRGPGQILQAPETVRAGGEAEYAFRVSRQRIGLQNEITKKWQEEMIVLMKQMVENNEADRGDLYRLQISSGQTVEGVN
jgi:hypothetical protein